MTETDTHPPLAASTASAILDRVRATPRGPGKSQTLTPEALAVASKPAPPPISPIVLAGVVRMAEFALIVLVGFAVYAAYRLSSEDLLRKLYVRDLRHRGAFDVRLPDR